jgi:hypothetical protein
MDYRFSERAENLIERVYENKKFLIKPSMEHLTVNSNESTCLYCKKLKKLLQDGYCCKCITFQELSKSTAIKWLDNNDRKYHKKKKLSLEEHFNAQISILVY